MRPDPGHAELFKCHHTDCPSGTNVEGGAWDEVGFLAYELKCEPKAAYVAWLKEAGLWQEIPSVPSQPGSKEPQTEPAEAAELDDPADENEKFADLTHASNNGQEPLPDGSQGEPAAGSCPAGER